MTTFNSQKDIWLYLINNGKITGKDVSPNMKKYYHFVNGQLVDENGRDVNFCFWDYKKWEAYKECTWYQNIPEEGILCWVKSDIDINSRKCVTLILKATKYGFEDSYQDVWRFATPLTKEELEIFIKNIPKES